MEQIWFNRSVNSKRSQKLGCLLTLLATVILPLSFVIPTGTVVTCIGCGRPEHRYKVDLQSIVIAIKGYQTEYNHLPLELLPAGESQSFPLRGEILSCLMGKKQHPSNPQDISFLEAKPARNGKGGIHMPEIGEPVFVDPWGHPYFVIVDADGNGEIPNPARGHRVGKGSDLVEPNTLSLGVIAFSAGPDGNPDTWEDNFVSWR